MQREEFVRRPSRDLNHHPHTVSAIVRAPISPPLQSEPMSRTLLLIALALAPLAFAQAHPRPTYPTRDPHAPGYVRATELPDGTVPPANKDGNFILGPTHTPAPEMTVNPGIPHGAVTELTLTSEGDTYYPGIARDPGTFVAADPDHPERPVVTTSHPHPWTRTIALYVPAAMN